MSRQPRRTVVILGMLGRAPFAGVAWQVLHYLEGFRRLGCDIYYVEDTGAWPYDPGRDAITDDPTYTVNYIARLMQWCRLPDRWAYRAPAQGCRYYGRSAAEMAHLWRHADALVNLTGATVLRDEHMQVPVRIYLETDPVLPEIEVAQGRKLTIDLLSAHTDHFTYGENLGAPDCGVPVGRFAYQQTRQPIVLDWWATESAPPPAAIRFTTIGSWQQADKDVVWNGETYYWSKHREFLKFVDLPRRTAQPLELALAGAGADVLRLLRSHGWRVADALALSRAIATYRDYILGSNGEFTVAKDQNIRLRSGWFSDRSACYLAAGKPVITQDTGFGNVLPTGRGLFAFRTMEDILAALDVIEADYSGNSRAARAVAESHFAAERVVGDLLAKVGL